MTVIEKKIQDLLAQMSQMLAAPSYNPVVFNALMRECKRLQALIATYK